MGRKHNAAYQTLKWDDSWEISKVVGRKGQEEEKRYVTVGLEVGQSFGLQFEFEVERG